MKLIADSGSTKTDWILTHKGKRVHKISTQGINPFYQNTSQITTVLAAELLPQIENITPNNVYFYGAGCSFPDKQAILKNAFVKVLGQRASIFLHSDLVGAARALYGTNAGIACIIGTGSNSCVWDGNKIIQNVPPLGYILGDEGSGAVLGKLLIADLLKNQLPKEISQKFYDKYRITYEELMSKVYKQPFPNRSLAQYSYFLSENIDSKEIYSLVKNSFTAFVKRNISQYPKHLKVGFIGSVSLAFKDIMVDILMEEGYLIGNFMQSPIEKLAQYHS